MVRGTWRADSAAVLLRSTLSLAALASVAALLAWGCAPASPEDDQELDGEEPTEETDAPVSNGNVEQAMSSTCSTASIKPLSQQIIDEMKCMAPNQFVDVPSRPNLVMGEAVFPYLIKPARDRLVQALDANPNKTMNVASMFRTVAQQYMLRRWKEQGRCGIKAAATPGNSNHETGLAIDLSPNSSWRSALESRGYDWFGSGDPPHFDYFGPGAVSQKGLDVEAFQRLWNRNNPNDKIDEDGAWGPQTQSRIKKSPAKGFPIGATCGSDADPQPDPQDDPTPQPQGEPWSCDGTTGTTPVDTGEYVATSFGCSVLEDGTVINDPGDNCIPACLSQLKSSGVCSSGSSGPTCEKQINWYAADRDRFGCGTKLRVTEPSSGKSAIVMVIDAGPACWVEETVDMGVVDLSYRATEHLFGGQVGVSEKQMVKVEVVSADTPLGPQ